MKFLEVLVKANSSRTEITSEEAGITKMNVKAKPDEGEANREIIKFFSRKYKEPVEIIRGARSRKKLIRIG